MNIKCPIAIVSGFLGSGKTTLLTQILKLKRFDGASVIVNEFGEVGLDHRLLYPIKEDTTLLNEGCVCCQKKEVLIKALKKLLFSHQNGDIPLKSLIIETTGLADPAPIMFSLLSDTLLVHHFYIDRVIVCIDALNMELHLKHNENLKQIAASDVIVITKTDLLPQEFKLETLKQKIISIAPTSEIFIGGKKTKDFFSAKIKHIPKFSQNKSHLGDIKSISIAFKEPLNWNGFGVWLSMLLHTYGENILRVKGIVDTKEDGSVVINGVQHIIHPPIHLPSQKLTEEKNSQLVFITKNLEPQRILNSLKTFEEFSKNKY